MVEFNFNFKKIMEYISSSSNTMLCNERWYRNSVIDGIKKYLIIATGSEDILNLPCVHISGGRGFGPNFKYVYAYIFKKGDVPNCESIPKIKNCGDITYTSHPVHSIIEGEELIIYIN